MTFTLSFRGGNFATFTWRAPLETSHSIEDGEITIPLVKAAGTGIVRP